MMKPRWWFTFVEILIALTVFAVGILAVLRLVTQNLVILDTVHLRSTATFLAQEWLALIYTMRDANLSKSLPWDCVLNPALASDDFWTFNLDTACVSYFASWITHSGVFHVAFASGAYMDVAFVDKWDDFEQQWSLHRLYYTTGYVGSTALFRYDYHSWTTSQLSPFARYIVFSPVYEWTHMLAWDKIIKVSSYVLYKKWTLTGMVVLESILGNY